MHDKPTDHDLELAQLERIKAEIADSFDEELEIQFEEERLNRVTIPQFLTDWRVIRSAVFDGVVENSGIRSESGHR